MAFRYRSVSQPTFSFIKTTFTKSSTNAKASASFINNTRSSTTLPRSIAQLGCVQSLLPLYSAVSSARLTSCLGIDSRSSRSLTREMGLSTPR
ncbi:hypothetical protein Lalb_Chr23g0269661 [Lupinus albus]|uniref:Uncharacterized protein n=1 Tax=Lupinus albus TaxID=3870 RepID=A0A6A4NKI5_LUPAL|nr:hypothetical protein Lalb_Chr23g0269661 [Lupinus albus]